MNPLYYAILAAISFALWTTFHKLAAPHINQTLGAVLVSFVAVILGSFFILAKQQNVLSSWNNTGLFFIFLAGLSALCLDIFVLQAYAKGLEISVGGPIIIGGSLAIAILIGIVFLGETFSLLKFLGIALIFFGAIILSRF
jgi:uncharacterized membrane protein